MPTDPNDIDPVALSAHHIQDMIGIEEHQHLDFKACLSLGKDSDKWEFLRDTVAMANGGGGYLVFGAKEESEKCVGFQSIQNADVLMQTMNQTMLDGISDRINGGLIKIHEFDSLKIITLYLPPESPFRPYMVCKERHTDFACRYGKDRRNMTISEIRAMFLDDRYDRKLDTIEQYLKRIVSEKSEESERRRQELLLEETGRIHDIIDYRILSSALRNLFKKRIAAKNTGMFRLSLIPRQPGVFLVPALEERIRQITDNPHGQRYGGWNVRSHGDLTRRLGAFFSGKSNEEELIIWENGALEYINSINHLGWAAEKFGVHGHSYIHPYPLCEFALTFVRLAKEIYDLFQYSGDFFLEYELFGVKGAMLRPYSPKAWGFMHEFKVYGNENITAQYSGNDLRENPDKWAFQIIRQVYHSFGFEDKEVPFFKDGHAEIE